MSHSSKSHGFYNSNTFKKFTTLSDHSNSILFHANKLLSVKTLTKELPEKVKKSKEKQNISLSKDINLKNNLKKIEDDFNDWYYVDSKEIKL